MKKDGVREATYEFYMTGQSPMSPRTDIDDQKDAFPHFPQLYACFENVPYS